MAANHKVGTRFSISIVALFASILAAAPYAAAHPPGAPPPADHIAVAGHLALQGIQVKQMFLQRSGDKTYLYLEQPSQHDFAVVDVTNPTKPALLEEAALPESAGEIVNMPAPDSVLAIAVVPDGDSPSSVSGASVEANLPTESVQFLDLSNPEHPSVLKTLSGVTSMTTDDGRKLVFIANNDGLWIVSHHHDRPLPLCTSDDSTALVPNCQ